MTYDPPAYTNFFDPVMHDIEKMLKPSKRPVTYTVDVFNEESAEGLNKLYNESLGKQIGAQGFVPALVFAVLDERSTQDDTVVICYESDVWDEEAYELGEAGEAEGTVLYTWRVFFADAYEMARLIEDCNLIVVDEYVLKAGARFTNEAGVFEFAKAVKAIDAGDRG